MNDYKWAFVWFSTFVGSCIIAVVLGMWLDQMLHTTPIIVLMLVAYAIIGNFYRLYKDMKKHE